MGIGLGKLRRWVGGWVAKELGHDGYWVGKTETLGVCPRS